MIYVFTFLGEFGYELFNWQGVIRKFSRTLGRFDRIVCCSRAHLYPLYETASVYIDISEVELFKNSQACCYSAIVPGSSDLGSWRNRILDRRLRASLRAFIYDRLQVPEPSWIRRGAKETFVFSSSTTRLNGCTFGCHRTLLEREGNIYDRLDLGNNLYKKIEPDLRIRDEVERQIGFDLMEPYVLVQTRARQIVVRSQDIVPKEDLIRALARRVRVVLLSFHTGRTFDSFSQFDASLGCTPYACRSFVEQACLVHFAKRCVFFTEGDFGSHMYVPPFMGKEVVAIAPRSIYELGTTPIEFWNRNVFPSGGRIIPRVSEEMLSSRHNISETVDEVLSR